MNALRPFASALFLAVTSAAFALFACGDSDAPATNSTPPDPDAGNSCKSLEKVSPGLETFDGAWKIYFEATSDFACDGDEIDWSQCGDVKTISCNTAEDSTKFIYDSSGNLVGTATTGLGNTRCSGLNISNIPPSSCTRHGYALGACEKAVEERCATGQPECPTDFTSAWSQWSTSGSTGEYACSRLVSMNCGNYKSIRCTAVNTGASTLDAHEWHFDTETGKALSEHVLKVDSLGQNLTPLTCLAGPHWIVEPTGECTVIDSVEPSGIADAGAGEQ